MSDILKTKLQIAIQKTVNTGGGDTEVHADFVDWFNKTRKHIVVYKGGRFEPIETSAVLIHYVSRWVIYVPLYDPIMLIDRFKEISGDTRIVYIYDLHLLGLMDFNDTLKFLSYMKYALMCNIRLVLAVPCSLIRADLDAYFKNKKVTDIMAPLLTDTKYFSKLGV